MGAGDVGGGGVREGSGKPEKGRRYGAQKALWWRWDKAGFAELY